MAQPNPNMDPIRLLRSSTYRVDLPSIGIGWFWLVMSCLQACGGQVDTSGSGDTPSSGGSTSTGGSTPCIGDSDCTGCRFATSPTDSNQCGTGALCCGVIF